MIVLTLGTFDTLHVGHLELLRGCRSLAGDGGQVVVAVNPDAFVARYKGRAPVQPYAQRVEILRACRYVDAVVANAGAEDSRQAIEVVAPDVIAIGADWLDPDAPDPEARYLAQLGTTHRWLADRGLHVEYLPRTRGVSSSGLRGAA